MRKLLIFLFANLISVGLWACSYAYQYSLYPMGMSGGQLVVLEVEMERYVNHPDFKMGSHKVFSADVESRWKGSLRLCYWHKTKGLEQIEVLARNIDISDSSYEGDLSPYFQRAYTSASELPFFEGAVIEQVGTCHFDVDCPFFQKKVLSEMAQGFCYLVEKPDPFYSLDVPQGILDIFVTLTNDKNFKDLSKVEPEVRTDFYKIWKPYATRIYHIGSQSFIAFTLGWGDKLPVPIATEKDWQKMPPPVEQFIEGREVLLHGYRFDFIHEM